MKNLFKNFLAIALSFTLFCCNDNTAPQPLPQPATIDISDNSNSRMVDPNQYPDRIPVPGKYWQLVNTSKIYINQSLKLTAPYTLAPAPAGDISWASGGCYNSLFGLTVKFVPLGIVDVNSITLSYLKTLTFTVNVISAAPLWSTSWPNNLPAGTLIACKTAAGKYYVIKAKDVDVFSYVEMEIYHGASLLP